MPGVATRYYVYVLVFVCVKKYGQQIYNYLQQNTYTTYSYWNLMSDTTAQDIALNTIAKALVVQLR